ncbi:class I SAM-dependent methyltransferase [Pseudohalocynthiibacter aestuariivivens]|uniref:Class I SAM-dependent methyltransferase n=1 Tax=Pseudohalocynthiibacter aestuariivivens TaxID=1591409 RepID=A0ABV5JI65_9RHOB|nr:methyltransferase domain-containing protein [Pseudohalocynthiibacter aestuariivivens]MBS9717454.1 methyltransferase domain-containing protein [Pseudohalocynthiibacter aestuariivivens]
MSDPVPTELLEAGRGYERLFVPALFAPWTKHLLEAVGVHEGDHVLDIACGTGVLARDALSRVGVAGSVVGVDAAPGMIAAAKELEANIDWVLGHAEALALEDASFDCTMSQFGMMFFEDREAAVHEMFRILKPGGKLAISVWNTIEENPTYEEIISVLREHVGVAAADAVHLPFTLGNHGDVMTLLERAGFSDIIVETKVESARFPSSQSMVEAELRGWLPLFDIHLGEARIKEVLEHSDRTLSKYVVQSGEAVFPTSGHVISARK